MDYCIGVSRGNKERNAGAKAPDDIISICEDLGMTIYLIPTKIGELTIFQKVYWKLLIPLFRWMILYIKIKKGDKLLNQHPLANNNIAEKLFLPLIKRKGVHTVCLIHDLTSLRSFGEISLEELQKIDLYDKIIVHNEMMKTYLIEKGILTNKLVVLEIFDYLTDSIVATTREVSHPLTIAGNLDPQKCSYLYQMMECNPELQVNLYGVGLDEERLAVNSHYKGSFSPEELIEKIEGGFGLVWDGDSIEGCRGLMGQYLKFNNPHKTSLFIVAELPIITWKRAAIADFIIRHNVGIVVNDLSDVTRVINDVSSAQYSNMMANIKKLAVDLKVGTFTKRAIQTALKN